MTSIWPVARVRTSKSESRERPASLSSLYTQPLGEIGLNHVTLGRAHDDARNLLDIPRNLNVVQIETDVHGLVSSPLVPVVEARAASDRNGVGSGKIENIADQSIGQTIVDPGERGVERLVPSSALQLTSWQYRVVNRLDQVSSEQSEGHLSFR